MPTLEQWLKAAGVVAGAALVGYLAQVVLLRRLRRLADKTDSPLDDLILDSVDGHVTLWFALAALSASAQTLPLPADHKTLAQKAVVAAFFASATWVAARFAGGAVRAYAPRVTESPGTTSLGENLARWVVFGMGAMLMLSNLGISITPVLTALGVGSLAVALALQDTLGNIIAGVHIVASRLATVGDYVKLDSGQEGYVVDVGWRATRVRELSNNIVVIPNTKLAQAVVVNYNLPEKEQAALVQVGVSYDSDLEKVERVTIDVAKRVMAEVTGGVPQFEPFIRYHTLADSSIDFTVILRAREFVDRYLLTHEFIKRLHARYAQEGIEIPFPQRVVTWKGPAPAAPAA